MAYNHKLAQRVRRRLEGLAGVEEKEMMGGLAFMYNGKMCVGIVNDDLMCRIGPEKYEESLEHAGCREMNFTGRSMRGWIFVSEEGMKSKKDFEHWIDLALEFNSRAKSSGKISRKKNTGKNLRSENKKGKKG